MQFIVKLVNLTCYYSAQCCQGMWNSISLQTIVLCSWPWILQAPKTLPPVKITASWQNKRERKKKSVSLVLATGKPQILTLVLPNNQSLQVLKSDGTMVQPYPSGRWKTSEYRFLTSRVLLGPLQFNFHLFCYRFNVSYQCMCENV